MDAQQLWETTLNPETRRMKRVEIEDARMASSVTEILMGSDVPPRKAFIYEHATDADWILRRLNPKEQNFSDEKAEYGLT